MRAFIHRPAPKQAADLVRSTKSESVAPYNKRDAAREAPRTAPPRGFDFTRIPVRHTTAERLQTKLTVNIPGDVHEQEADRIADAVMRMPQPGMQSEAALDRASALPASLQTSATPAGESGGFPAPPIVHEVLRSPGRPLDSATRAFMEPRFGQDFSRVRVHTDAQAAESGKAVKASEVESDPLPSDLNQIVRLGFSGSTNAVPYSAELGPKMGSDFRSVQGYFGPSASRACDAINAEAFTVGNKIAFRQFDPSKRLVAHELAHVVQQDAGMAPKRAQFDLRMTSPADQVERQADDVAARVIAGQDVRLTKAGDVKVARQTGVVEAAELAMGAIAIVREGVVNSRGHLAYSSQEITFPSTLPSPMPAGAKSISTPVAEFHSTGFFTEDHTIFNLHGDFSHSFERANANNRFMANVYIDLEDSTDYDFSELTFEAVAQPTAYGSAADPKVRFRCRGHFDPSGRGECEYSFTLEVDQHGSTRVTEHKVTGKTGSASEITGPFYFLSVGPFAADKAEKK